MGGLKRLPTEGGSGGKRGHSGMEHWTYTEEIKDASRVRRRIQAKVEIRDHIKDSLAEEPTSDVPVFRTPTPNDGSRQA